MKSIAILTFGVLGSIVLGVCSVTSSLGFKVPIVGEQSRFVRTQKTVLNEISFTEPASGSAAPLHEFPNTADPEEAVVHESDCASTLRKKVAILDQGRSHLLTIDDYTGIFQKQEVVHGALLNEQTIEIKCRHRPFSVYLNWLGGDAGREVIYIEGQNNGKMIAHDGGWKARIPALTLPTDGMLAMRDARYPVTTAGIVGLIDIMRGVHEQDLLRSNIASCDIDHQRQFDGRPCSMFTIKYKSQLDSSVYRKSITLIDHEWNVPVYTRHFEWPSIENSTMETSKNENQTDEATLIECYSFTSLKFNCQLTDDDFDRKNPEYHFR